MRRASSVLEPPSVAADAEPLSIREVEIRYMNDLLARYNNGQRNLVAQAMGISERTLYRKLRRHAMA